MELLYLARDSAPRAVSSLSFVVLSHSGNVRVDALLFSSSSPSLPVTCMLVVTLMQQWSQSFLQMVQEHGSEPPGPAQLEESESRRFM